MFLTDACFFISFFFFKRQVVIYSVIGISINKP